MKRRTLLKFGAAAAAVAAVPELVACGTDGVPDKQRHPIMVVAGEHAGRLTLTGAVVIPNRDATSGPFDHSILTQDVRWNRESTSPAVVATDGRGRFGVSSSVDEGRGVTPDILRAAYEGTARSSFGDPVQLYTATTEVPVEQGAITLEVGQEVDTASSRVIFIDSQGHSRELGPEGFAALAGLVVHVDGGGENPYTLGLTHMQPPQPDPFAVKSS